MRVELFVHESRDTTGSTAIDYMSTNKDVIVKFYDVEEELHGEFLTSALCYMDEDYTLVDRGDLDRLPPLTGQISHLMEEGDNCIRLKINRTSLQFEKKQFCIRFQVIATKQMVSNITPRYTWFSNAFSVVTKLNRKKRMRYDLQEDDTKSVLSENSELTQYEENVETPKVPSMNDSVIKYDDLMRLMMSMSEQQSACFQYLFAEIQTLKQQVRQTFLQM
jgi:hypothetical protein